MNVKKFKAVFAGALCFSMLMTSLVGCGGAEDIMELDLESVMEQADDSQKEELDEYLKEAKNLGDKEEKEDANEGDESVKLSDIKFSGRPSIISKFMQLSYEEIKPSIPEYEVEPDLSNVINVDQFWMDENDEVMEKLAENQFVVMPWTGDEFFDIYEPNRYDYIPNFITVDSMLHTYHLYFAYLLKMTEMNELCDMVEELSAGL